MTNKEKKQAERKADLALCKLQDIFYLNATDAIVRSLNDACDNVRELIYQIENAETKK